MRIENEMLSRFKTLDNMETTQNSLSQELDFFFDNVMDSVVMFFDEKATI